MSVSSPAWHVPTFLPTPLTCLPCCPLCSDACVLVLHLAAKAWKASGPDPLAGAFTYRSRECNLWNFLSFLAKSNHQMVHESWQEVAHEACSEMDLALTTLLCDMFGAPQQKLKAPKAETPQTIHGNSAYDERRWVLESDPAL